MGEEDSGEGHPSADKASAENNKKRRLKTPAQLLALENFYEEHKYPSEELKSKLAEEIGLTNKQVSGWLCHRRLKDKRSSKDEVCGTGRQDRSSVVIQDRGSGLRQDSCGSTKQADHKNTDLREVESQRLSGRDFSAAGLVYENRSQYPQNDGAVDSTSSESSSSLQDRVAFRKEGLYNVKSSGYLTKGGGAIMPPIPPVARNTGYKPSGYLKVKGEIENAAITAVKRQLGRDYREDGPPLGVEFDPLPPGAFESPTNNVVNEPVYVGARGRANSPGVSGLQKLPNLAPRYEVYNSKRHSPDPYVEVANDSTIHGTSFKERKRQRQLQQRSPLNDSSLLPQQKYLLDATEDPSSQTSLFNGKKNNKINSKHSSAGLRYGSVPSHRDVYGDLLTGEQNRKSLLDYDKTRSKHAQKSTHIPRPSNMILEHKDSPGSDEGGAYAEMVEKCYGERMPLDRHRDPVGVSTHLIDESPPVGKRARFGFPLEVSVRKTSYNEILPRKSQTKRPALQVPSSFSEDETAETSSSMD